MMANAEKPQQSKHTSQKTRIMLRTLFLILLTTAWIPLFSQEDPVTCINRALDFGGDGWVQAANSPLTGDADFTIELWAASQSTSSGCSGSFRRMIGWGGPSNNRFELGECTGELALFFNPTTTLVTVAGTDLRDGLWHHIAAVRSGSTLTVYYDGVAVYTTSSFPTMNFNTPFRVGRWPGGTAPNEDWLGQIDEVRVWDGPRSVADLLASPECPVDPSEEPDLVLYYNFDEGIPFGNNTGAVVLDQTANGNDGTIFNLTLSGTTSNYICSQLPPSLVCNCTEEAPNRSLHFDGEGWIDIQGTPLTGDPDFTIETWFYSESTSMGCSGNFRRLFGLGGNDSRFEVGECSGNMAVFYFQPNSLNQITSTQIRDNAWHHVAATKQGNEVRLYLDCEEIFTSTDIDVDFGTDPIFRVGRWPGGPAPNENWLGEMDNFRVWDYARTLDEIDQTKNCPLEEGTPGLLVNYDFEEGVPLADNTGITAVPDQSGLGHIGEFNTDFALDGLNGNYRCSGIEEGANCVCIRQEDQQPGNHSLHFDGTGYLQVGSSPSIPAGGSFTVEAHFYTESTSFGCSGNFRRILGWAGPNNERFELGECSGFLTVFFNTPYTLTNLTAPFLRDGNWHHVAAVKEANTLSVFLDCELVYQTNTLPSNFTLDQNLRIGRWPGGAAPNENWQGALDNIRIWDYPRSQSQLLAEKDCIYGNNVSGLLLHYDFDEGNPEQDNTGLTVVPDLSGNGNDATFMNFNLLGSQGNYICSNPFIGPCIVNVKEARRNLEGLELYPNPAQDFFTLELETPVSPGSLLNIYHSNGMQMRSVELEGNLLTKEISIVDLAPGVWWVEVVTDRGIYLEPLIIQ